ncbi:MAG: aldo/keto reductase [Ferruginibacter sp.]
MIQRNIPSTGELIPVIGLGTWQTFDVTEEAYGELQKVLKEFHKGGGSVIDSSPMYGRSEKVVGDISSGMEEADDFFYATKVWVSGKHEGISQMQSSFIKMKRSVMDLIQVHNLLDWKTQLATLRQWKEEGKLRFTGITHYTDSSHEELERIIKSEPVDFVQFNYSIIARNAERRLLDAAADNGVATLINRPFGEGKLFRAVQGKSLPAWAKELGIESWATYFLKYIISHQAVTCVIPATSNPLHLLDNMNAGKGNLPAEEDRKKMLKYLEKR